jgi:outer membrane protein, heavy metal efflux system
MLLEKSLSSRGGDKGAKFFFVKLLNWGMLFLLGSVPVFSQQPVQPPTQPSVRLTSAEFVGQDGLSVERLLELGASRRADLLAARQRLAIAEGRLRQARLRPNPTLDAEYGSPRFLGGEPESDLSIGVSQVFELGGKRRRRVAVAELELAQIRAEVLALERQLAVGIRAAYTSALAAARQLDVLERLIAGNEEIVRVTEARLKEGDVAPLDVNLVRVENDRLKVQAIQARNELETQLLQLRTLIGADVAESLRLAPQPDRPPRFDAGLGELTELALKERADLQAARLGEELGNARINLARANAVPNVSASVRVSRAKGIIDLPENIGGIATDTDNELTFGVSVDIPIFNRNQGEIASATGERLQATRNREFLEASVKRDVAVAYRRYRAAAESLVLYTTQILPRSEENLRSVRAAYGLGEFSVFEVVNEQRRLAENVTNYNQTLRDYYTALTELETAIGRELPASGFAPEGTSVLPDPKDNPNQVDRAKLLKAIEEVKMPRKSVLPIAETGQGNKEKTAVPEKTAVKDNQQ